MNRTSGCCLLIVTALLISSFFLSNCATVPIETDMDGSLRRAADEYWKLRMADKYENTYKMEDPEGLPPFQTYQQKVTVMKKLPLVSYSIRETKIDFYRATVDVEIGFRLAPISTPLKDVLKDQWVYKKGKWWHVLSP